MGIPSTLPFASLLPQTESTIAIMAGIFSVFSTLSIIAAALSGSGKRDKAARQFVAKDDCA